MALIIFKRVKGFKNYQISNYGDVFNVKSCQFLTGHKTANGGIIIGLSSKGVLKNMMLHKLVWKHFKKSEIGNKLIMHLDYNKENNYTKNLKKFKRGDYLRLWNEFKNKPRGVYKFNTTSSKKKWRAVLKIRGKAQTLGYFKKKHEAVEAYYTQYIKIYNRPPYELF